MGSISSNSDSFKSYEEFILNPEEEEESFMFCCAANWGRGGWLGLSEVEEVEVEDPRTRQITLQQVRRLTIATSGIHDHEGRVGFRMVDCSKNFESSKFVNETLNVKINPEEEEEEENEENEEDMKKQPNHRIHPNNKNGGGGGQGWNIPSNEVDEADEMILGGNQSSIFNSTLFNPSSWFENNTNETIKDKG